MTGSYELLIGRRYLRAGRGNRFISFISSISMLGVAIGVAVLLIVLSVMNGFEHELRARILGFISHATISAFGEGIEDWQSMAEKVRAHPEVLAAAPFIEDQALLIAGDKTSGAAISGVDPAQERAVSSVVEKIQAGSFDALVPGKYGIVLGSELAKALAVGVGDRVVMATSQSVVTPAGVMPRMRGFQVVGIVHAGMYEFDRASAYLNLQDAARVYRMGKEITGLRLKVDDLFAAPRIVRDLAISLGGGYRISDWTLKNGAFFKAIQQMKSMMFFMLVLIIAVAAFNIIATLVMVVKEKQSDIAILRTLGARPAGILAIFATQGMVISGIGTLAGVLLGLLISVNLQELVRGLESLLGTQFLDAQLYLMSDLPARVQWLDVLKIGGTAFGLCCLSTLYPSWRASRTEPARALRHE